MEELESGLFNLGGGTLYDADEDIFIELIKRIKGGSIEIGGKYKNPLEKAKSDVEKDEKNKEWIIEKGPEEISKLVKKREKLDNVINKLNQDLVDNGIKYNINKEQAEMILSNYLPYIKAGKKMKIENIVKKSVGENASKIYTEYLKDHPNIQYVPITYPLKMLEYEKKVPYLPQIEHERLLLKSSPKKVSEYEKYFFEDEIENINNIIDVGKNEINRINKDIENLKEKFSSKKIVSEETKNKYKDRIKQLNESIENINDEIIKNNEKKDQIIKKLEEEKEKSNIKLQKKEEEENIKKYDDRRILFKDVDLNSELISKKMYNLLVPLKNEYNKLKSEKERLEKTINDNDTSEYPLNDAAIKKMKNKISLINKQIKEIITNPIVQPFLKYKYSINYKPYELYEGEGYTRSIEDIKRNRKSRNKFY